MSILFSCFYCEREICNLLDKKINKYFFLQSTIRTKKKQGGFYREDEKCKRWSIVGTNFKKKGGN
jgi:hypothetical protein